MYPLFIRLKKLASKIKAESSLRTKKVVEHFSRAHKTSSPWKLLPVCQ